MRAQPPAYQALRTANYRKSSRSSGAQNCVMVGTANGWVGLRDSKLGADSPILAFTTAEWRALIAAIRDGELDA